MVKKPNVRQESFQELKETIQFWEERIKYETELLKNSKAIKNKHVRTLLKLQKRYAEQ